MSISWLKVPEEKDLPEAVRTLFAKAREKFGFVPNVFRVFALAPEHFLRWFNYYDFLMRGEGFLSRRERELLAVVVSRENACEYCLASHAAYLREEGADPIQVDVLTHNPRRAEGLTARERALIEFAIQMTRNSAEMRPEDLEPLRQAGLSDEAIFEAAQIVAMFNFTNRLANALGWKPNPEYYGMHR